MEEINQIESIILHYIQGNISEKEIRELYNWLDEKENNKHFFFKLKEIYDLRKGGLYPEKEEITQSLLRLTEKMKAGDLIKHKTPANIKNRLIGLYKYAATALIFIFLTLSIQMLFHKDKSVMYTELNVESGPRMSRLTLPDGTKVVLNASTKFKFPNSFNNELREVFLDGEAFFDVVHNEKTPFVVHTEKQKINVLGTEFNVMDYSSDDYTITTVIKGSVKVQYPSEKGDSENEYILKPNQQIFFNKATSEAIMTNEKIDFTRSWVNKVYHFNNEPLLMIAQRLEKIYGIKICITTESLKDVRYTGTFLTNLGIADVLKIINFDKQFSYKIEGETIVIQ